MKLRKNKGFTLIELMFIMAILGILAAAIIPFVTEKKIQNKEKIKIEQPVVKPKAEKLQPINPQNLKEDDEVMEKL